MAGIVPYVLDRMNNLTLRCATPCLSFRYLNFCLEMGERRFALGQRVELIVTLLPSLADRSQHSFPRSGRATMRSTERFGRVPVGPFIRVEALSS
jgi:hypothetical protein